MENRHYHASSCCLHFGKMVKPERFPVVKWARIQFKLDIVLPLPARPQVKTSHVPIGEYEYECLLPGWQAASWALVPHCFTRLCAIAKVECPKSGPLLLPAAALHRHRVLCRIAGDSICQMKICCCPCSNENSAAACVSIVQDMKHEFMLPLCHCPCPINSIVSRT